MARREYYRVPKRTRIIWFVPAAANLVVNVDVAGSVTWTGAANVTLVQTTSQPIVDRRRRRKPERVVRGSRIQRFTPTANLVVNVDTAGQILWTGQTISLGWNIRVSVPGVPLLWTGQTLPLAFKDVISAGLVTWTGATDITLVQTFSAPIVKRRLRRKPKRIVRGSRIARFTPLVAGVSNVDTPGQITYTGQSLTLAQNVIPTAGAITWTGQTIGLTFGTVPTSGLVTWSGATDITLVQTTSLPYFTKRQPRRPKRLLRGSRLARFTALVAGSTNVDTPGQILWTGQALPLKFTITPTQGTITWSGQTVGLQSGIVPTAGSIIWAGQTIPLKYVVVIIQGQIIWSGQTVFTVGGNDGIPVKGPTRKRSLVGTNATSSALTSPVRAPSLVGTGSDTEELAGSPRAVPIGGGSNDLEEV